jgi:Domain of unknown function (DUF1707)
MDRAGWSYPPGDYRVSDADRDRALAELSAAFQVGRITADEFDERSGQTVRSRTGKELAALLADLPAEHAPVMRTTGMTPAHRVVANRVSAVAAAAAFCFATAAAVGALSTGPTLQEEEVAKAIAARQGMPIPVFPPSTPFNWAGTLTPAAIAVLLVVLVVFLRVRVARADRRR